MLIHCPRDIGVRFQTITIPREGILGILEIESI